MPRPVLFKLCLLFAIREYVEALLYTLTDNPAEDNRRLQHIL